MFLGEMGVSIIFGSNGDFLVVEVLWEQEVCRQVLVLLASEVSLNNETLRKAERLQLKREIRRLVKWHFAERHFFVSGANKWTNGGRDQSFNF